MISPSDAHMGINIGFHVLILFFFLTMLFFAFISKKEKDAISKELNNVIEDQIPIVLQNIDDTNKKFGKGDLPWDKINSIAEKMKKQKIGSEQQMNSHNKNLKIISGIIISVLLIGLITAILYFSKYKKYNIHLGSILLENFIIFIFVGIIEVAFFLMIALNYVPATTTDMVNTIIDRFEYRINKNIPV